MGVASKVPKRHGLKANSLIFNFYNLSVLSSTMLPEPYMQACFGDVSIGTGLHHFAFCLDEVFCNGLCYHKKYLIMYFSFYKTGR